MFQHEWEVVLVQDERGEIARYTVRAYGYMQAITWALDQLRHEGRHAYRWEVAKVARGDRIKRASETA